MEDRLSKQELKHIKEYTLLSLKERGFQRCVESAERTYTAASAKAQNTVLPADKEEARLICARVEYRLQVIMDHREELFMTSRKDPNAKPMDMEAQEWVQWMLDKGESFDFIIGEIQFWKLITSFSSVHREDHEKWMQRERVAYAMQVIMR